MKKFFSLLLALVMVFVLIPGAGATAFAQVVPSGADIKETGDINNVKGDYVLSVTVNPEKQMVRKGTGFTFNADVDGSITEVIWSVSGNNSSGTTINPSTGYIYVASGETAEQLTVRATSTFLDSKYGEATVYVVDYTPVINGVAISPKTSSVRCDGYLYFNVTVDGTDFNDVVWTLYGNENEATYINDGCLYVSAYETASTLTVRATSARNSSKYDEASVTVLQLEKIHSLDLRYDEASVTLSTALTGEQVTSMLIDALDESETEDIIYYDKNPTYTCLVRGVTPSASGDVSCLKLGYSSENLSEEEEYYFRFEIQTTGIYGWDPSAPPTITVNGKTPDYVRWNGTLRLRSWVYVYVKAELVPNADYVSSVTVSPEKQMVRKGTGFTFNADVDGSITTVSWSVSGNNSSGTTINPNTGYIYVAAGETAEQLKVRATSTFNGAKFDEATVYVVDYTPVINSVSVTPKTTSVRCDSYKYFDVMVDGTDFHDVVWTLYGNENESTYINDGNLYVSTYETASTLTVRATSARNGLMYDEATVTVLQLEKIHDVDLKYDETAVVLNTELTGAQVTSLLLDALDKEATEDIIYYDARPEYTCLVKNVSQDSNGDRKSTRLNSSHPTTSRMPSSA